MDISLSAISIFILCLKHNDCSHSLVKAKETFIINFPYKKNPKSFSLYKYEAA